MRHRIGMAVVCLHVATGLYLLLWLLMCAVVWSIGRTEHRLPATIFLTIFCGALAAGLQVVVFGLGRRKFWAWVAGLIVFGSFAPSVFMPLGVFGLWGLLDDGSRAEFGVGGGRA